MENAKRQKNRRLRKQRIRAKVKGTSVRPRMTVSISNRHIYVQVIDDDAQKTLASVSTIGNSTLKGTMTQKAKWVGQEIAKRAAKIKIAKVVLDRNGRKYHGRIAALAEEARQNGLEF